MLGYSDQNYNHLSPAKSTSPLSDRSSGSNEMKRGALPQLAPLWEHLVRAGTLPPGADLSEIFRAIAERLRHPEWEIRQHALRVLVDLIPVIVNTSTSSSLDMLMERLLGDLVSNLGHPGPAVRKGALDSLKVYLGNTTQADEILKNIVYRGIDHYHENQIQPDVVVGIILSLPTLVFTFNTSNETLQYIVTTLTHKLVQVTFQEVSLRSLVKIRELIGPDFDNLLQESEARDFDLLCQVYNIQPEEKKWNDLNANLVDTRWNSDSDGVSQDESKSENKPKVILETEVQFKNTALTMTILEENQKNSDFESEDDRDCIVKILSDSDNDGYELRRRTPRRVRFGGEHVKLRTPDSDNLLSDTDNELLTINTKNPIIEIKFLPEDRKVRKNVSHIPVPIVPAVHKPKARSLPGSPIRKMPKSKLLYQSHPNLIREHFFNKKKIKKHREVELLHNLARSPQPSISSLESDRKIPSADSVLPNGYTNSDILKNRAIPLPYKPLSESPLIPKSGLNGLNTNVKSGLNGLNTNVKNGLNRLNPERYSSANKSDTKFSMDKEYYKNRFLSIDNSVVAKDRFLSENNGEPRFISDVKDFTKPIPLPYKPLNGRQTPPKLPKVIPLPYKEPIKPQTPDLETISVVSETTDTGNQSAQKTYSSFVLKDEGSEPDVQLSEGGVTSEGGAQDTCSSSGSEGMPADPTWESAEFVEKHIIEDMNNKDDWRIRLRGFEAFGEALRRPGVLERVSSTSYMSAMLHCLWGAERHQRLQHTVEEIVRDIIVRASEESLREHLGHFASGLSRMAAPSGVRLGVLLMQRLSAREFVPRLLEAGGPMTAKSARCREGALQLLLAAARLFPSTELGGGSAKTRLAARVGMLVADRRRRVRRAALDVLAALGQLGLPGEILEVVTQELRQFPDRDQMIAAVRARLSRRQLANVSPEDGTVTYATAGTGTGADTEWVGAGTGSISPVPHYSGRRSARRGSHTSHPSSAVASQGQENQPPPQQSTQPQVPVTTVYTVHHQPQPHPSALASQRLPENNVTQSNNRSSSAVPVRNLWSGRKYASESHLERPDLDKRLEKDELSWALVPYGHNTHMMEEPQNRRYSQIWTLEQPPPLSSVDQRLSASTGSMRPVYVIPANGNIPVAPPSYVSRKSPPDESDRPAKNTPPKRQSGRISPSEVHSGGRRFSPPPPPVRLAQVRVRNRGVNSSPPDYNRGDTQDRRSYAPSLSSASSHSRGSPPRGNNWGWRERDHHQTSGIPVPVDETDRPHRLRVPHHRTHRRRQSPHGQKDHYYHSSAPQLQPYRSREMTNVRPKDSPADCAQRRSY